MTNEDIKEIHAQLEKDLMDKKEREKIRNRRRLFIFGILLFCAIPFLSLIPDSLRGMSFFGGLLFLGGGIFCIAASTEGGEKLPFNI